MLKDEPRGGLLYTNDGVPTTPSHTVRTLQISLKTPKPSKEDGERTPDVKLPAKYQAASKILRDLSYKALPGIHQAGPHVTTKRTYGWQHRPEILMRSLIEFAAKPEAAAESIAGVLYSKGSKEGFERRLVKFMDTQTVNVGTILDFKGALKSLMTALPVKQKVKTWTDLELWEIIKNTKISKNSSAGPGFWMEKGQCLNEILTAAEDIVKASNNGTLDKYAEEHQELFICECKNKEDRYNTSKHHLKTRPYFCFSAPLALLFSSYLQEVTQNMKLFYEDENCFNAYGFSWAHGGGEKMWNWAVSTKMGQKKVAIYGDDAKFVWRNHEGLFEVNPDFEQMDASVDADTANISGAWISLMTEHSPTGRVDGLQTNMLKLWSQMAVKATFIVDSTTAYSKVGGLRTGIVGTTLIDTIKSTLAYRDMIDKGIDPANASAVINHMATHGLRIKEGTYKVRKIDEDRKEPGTIALDPFLGVYLRWTLGHKQAEPIPYITRQNAYEIAGNPKMHPQSSITQTNRYLFDYARGVMLTFGFMHDDIWNSMIRLILSLIHI